MFRKKYCLMIWSLADRDHFLDSSESADGFNNSSVNWNTYLLSNSVVVRLLCFHTTNEKHHRLTSSVQSQSTCFVHIKSDWFFFLFLHQIMWTTQSWLGVTAHAPQHKNKHIILSFCRKQQTGRATQFLLRWKHTHTQPQWIGSGLLKAILDSQCKDAC